jgi:hypothetical protein
LSQLAPLLTHGVICHFSRFVYYADGSKPGNHALMSRAVTIALIIGATVEADERGM